MQTIRLAGADLASSLALVAAGGLARWAAETEAAARARGHRVPVLRPPAGRAHRIVADEMAPILAAGEVGFFSADLIEEGVPSVAMAAACARAVLQLAAPRRSGSATCASPPLPTARRTSRLPAAYHAGGPPRFAVAVQAADVVVDALRGPGSMAELEDRLVLGLEQAAAPIERIADALAARLGYPFVGIDLSPAPFPSDDVSIGGAVEAAGVERFGAPGTLYVAALITRAIRRTRLRRSGFSGLMLPGARGLGPGAARRRAS